MRRVSSVITGGGASLILALSLAGCGKVEQKSADVVSKPRAEAKRHRVACASSVAYDRLKGLVFDQAVDRHAGDRANLDILADYSVVRIEEPVVDGWDSALDLTRCTGRFILQIPPGAERAFGGERRLEADIRYTAQAAADGSGFVYRLNGAEAIIARLAAFNLSVGAYRPSPAIDPGQDDAAGSADTAPDRADVPPPLSDDPVGDAPDDERLPTRPAQRASDVAGRDPDAVAAGSRTDAPGRTGETVIRTFYGALGGGDGRTASAQMIPEKRTSRSFAPEALSRFYGQLAEPIRLTRIVPLAGNTYQVSYRYAAGRSRCRGSAVIRLANRDGRTLIRSIDALDGC
ncbi:hypothetical protein [Sphingomonas montana]|uniref:hypothetical protein n=1 Tax=Sphingomonas montana TaxID=1843236 RepID=UPI00101AD766|nr:hypothetical protein [Sphingomonas montana]